MDKIVQAFEEQRLDMWFREPLPSNSIIHELPLKTYNVNRLVQMDRTLA